MPSRRKRIGSLPSFDIQKIITSISKKEKLSQSKVVGILVGEALRSRGGYAVQYTNNLIRNTSYNNRIHVSNSSLKNSYLDVLISNKGITYNT
tara:strand:+ start:163 stop:441 length:279 start_codon:yes stop_codon:yes gene_type:complete